MGSQLLVETLDAGDGIGDCSEKGWIESVATATVLAGFDSAASVAASAVSAGFDWSESVATPMAGFADDRRCQPGGLTVIPADLR